MARGARNPRILTAASAGWASFGQLTISPTASDGALMRKIINGLGTCLSFIWPKRKKARCKPGVTRAQRERRTTGYRPHAVRCHGAWECPADMSQSQIIDKKDAQPEKISRLGPSAVLRRRGPGGKGPRLLPISTCCWTPQVRDPMQNISLGPTSLASQGHGE